MGNATANARSTLTPAAPSCALAARLDEHGRRRRFLVASTIYLLLMIVLPELQLTKHKEPRESLPGLVLNCVTV